MNINQTDLNTYLSTLGCCAGKKAQQLAKDYLYGSSCKDKDLQDLTLLNAYVDMLSCYKIQQTTNTNNTFIISFRDYGKLFVVGDIISIYLNGIRIVNYTYTGLSLCSTMSAIVTLLAAQTNYVIGGDDNCSTNQITLTTFCQYNNCVVTINNVIDRVTTLTYIPVVVKSQGSCITKDTDNCLTETQVISILENISIVCKKCLKTPGFAYYTN